MAERPHLGDGRRAGCQCAGHHQARGARAQRAPARRCRRGAIEGADPRAIRAAGAAVLRVRAALGRWRPRSTRHAAHLGSRTGGGRPAARRRHSIRDLSNVSGHLPSRLLIANRGEIACRIARTARRLGWTSIAVYSEADRGAPHVRAADEAYYLGASPPAQSYLNQARVLEVARRAGAHAVHPGYGFLSENAHFAEAVTDAGLTFIGPPAAAIRAMGSKSAAKAAMAAAGVPVAPGYHGSEQTLERLQAEAERVGFPLIIKASAGGGGKGMQVVHGAGEVAAAVGSAQRLARAAFGEDRLLLERYFPTARHVEVQVFADTRGDFVA